METLNSNTVTRNLLSENRLQRELSEWERIKNKYPCVEVVPLQSSIYEWHCNIVANDGVFIGLIFHIIIKFSQNYPLTPPIVYLCNPIAHHPNVGADQCIYLDKLAGKRSPCYYNYNGWISGYGVVSILKRLKSCLFEESLRVCDVLNYCDSNTNHNFSRESLKLLNENVTKFQCVGCGHCFEKPYPVPPYIMFIKKECNYLGINNIKTLINDNNIKQSNYKLARKCSNLLDIFGDNNIGNNEITDAFNDFEFILQTFSMLNNSQSEFLKKYFIGQAASKLMQKRYDINKDSLSEKIRSVCHKLLIVVTEILKKKTTTTTVNNSDKMDIVDENVITSIIFSILNNNSNFYHQCLREYYISPFCLNKKHLHVSKWRRELTKGSKLDCLDCTNCWYSCTVIDFNENTNEILIKYFGFGDKWNEWVARDNPRLQPFKSVGKGEKVGGVRRHMTSVVAKNFRKYEHSDEDDTSNRDGKKFGVFRGLVSQNISFRLVEAMNVFDENNGFNLLLKVLPLMKNMRNVKCILTVLEKLSRSFTPVFRDEYIPLLHNCVVDLLHDLTNDSLKQLNLDILNDLINSMKEISLLCKFKLTRNFYHFGGDRLKQEITLKQRQCLSISRNNQEFCFWDGMYQDLENLVLKYLNVCDLSRLSHVSKRFQFLVYNSRLIQKNRIKCWFYHSPNHFDGHRLCLGFGIIPSFICINMDNSKGDVDLLDDQLCLSDEFESLRKVFGQKYESYFDKLIASIGQYPLLKSINTRFDLLSSDAFEKHHIRRVCGDNYDDNFSHFLPLWIDDKHGELCMKNLPQYIKELLAKKSKEYGYHPFLALYCVAVAMSSLIKFVINGSISNGAGGFDPKISLDKSRNVIETFFRYYHLLLAIYCQHEHELSPIIQKQMKLFFRSDENDITIKNRKCFSNLGVFFMFVPLWKQKQNMKKQPNKKEKIKKFNYKSVSPEWENIVQKLLNETLIRQVPLVIKKYPKLVEKVDVWSDERLRCTLESTDFSSKLFLLQVFFIKHCVTTVYGSNYISLHEQLDKYNKNYGFVDNGGVLSIKLQKYVNKIGKICNYPQFFKMIELDYPGDYPFRLHLEGCIELSDKRGYKKTIVTNLDDDKENSKNISIGTLENGTNLIMPMHPNSNVFYRRARHNGMITGAPLNINGTMAFPILNAINTNWTNNCMKNKNVASYGNENLTNNNNSDNCNYNAYGEMIYKPPSPSSNRNNGRKPLKPTKPPITHKAYLVEALTKHNGNKKNDSPAVNMPIMTNINDYTSLDQISQTNSGIHDDEHDQVSSTSGGARSRRRGMRKSLQNKMKQMTKQERNSKQVNVGSNIAVEDVTIMNPKRRRRRRGKRKGKGTMNENGHIIMNKNNT